MKYYEKIIQEKRNQKMNNSADEKENENFTVVRKFTYKECLVTVIKKTDGKYSYIIEKDGHEETKDKDFSTQDAAERDAKKEVDMVWNSDEEKSYYAKIVEQKHNASETDIRAMYTKIQELKKKGITGANIDKYYAAINTRKQAEDFLRKFKETGNKDYKYAAENLIKKAEQLEAEITRSINK